MTQERIGYNQNLQQVDPDFNTCLCKTVKDESEPGGINYFIRSDPSIGYFHNPFDPPQIPSFNFRRVRKDTFDLYVRFLRTQNNAWLNQAQREI